MKKLATVLLIFFLCPGLFVRGQVVPAQKKIQQIALTFDACMTTGMLRKLESGAEKSMYNEEIISYLQEEKVAATLFITGLWAERYPEAVKKFASDPRFEIGNHSYSHRGFTGNCYALPLLPEKEKLMDLEKSQAILTSLTGKRPLLFRFPGGCSNPSDQAMVQKMGLKVVGWSLASGDAFNSDTHAIAENVLLHAKSGSIVVFHLLGGKYAPRTAEVIRMIVPELKKRGFVFVKVSELTHIYAPSPTTPLF